MYKTLIPDVYYKNLKSLEAPIQSFFSLCRLKDIVVSSYKSACCTFLQLYMIGSHKIGGFWLHRFGPDFPLSCLQ